MGEWKDVPFHELFKAPLRNGLNKPSRVRGSGLPMVNMNEIFKYDFIDDTTPMELVPVNENELNTLLVRNDLLFARQSLIESGAGKISIYRGDAEVVFESHLIRCRIDDSLASALFLYYFFKSPVGRGLMSTIVYQTAAAGIRGSDLMNLEVPKPPLDEQRAIASVLSSLDAKIDLLHRQNKTLEAMAEALFRQWFVEEAEEGWEEMTVADIADVTSGKRPPERFAVATSEARVPVWGGNGPMAYTREALVDSEVILTGRVGTLGSIFRINTPIWPSDNTLLLTARRPEAKEFLFQQLRSIDFAQLNRGSTQPLLTQSDLKAQSFPMPSDELLLSYHEISRGLYAKLDANLRTTQTLTALRDTLLPKLMSGEVRVEKMNRAN